MGSVPESYFESVMHYAPFFYVVPTVMTADSPAGQRNISVADGSKLRAGFPVQIKDSVHSEWNGVESIAGDVVILGINPLTFCL